MKKVKCLNCGEEQVLIKIYNDELGPFTLCNDCESSFDVDLDNLKIKGHIGTWYAVEKIEHNDNDYYLLEHETYGNDADWIAIDSEGNLVLEDITDGEEELLEFLNS